MILLLLKRLKFLFKWCIENRFKSIYFFYLEVLERNHRADIFPKMKQMNLDFFQNRKKILIIIFFIIYSTISGQIVVPKDFMKIPDSLFYKEQLYKNINPNKQYNYWKVVRKTSSEDQIVFESKKNYSSQPEINNNISDGFFVECLPDGCFSYLEVYCNNTPRYINTEVGLKEFMGYIDNLSEALLIAKT